MTFAALERQSSDFDDGEPRTASQKRGFGEKQLKRWVHDAQRKLALNSILCKLVMLVASALSIGEAVFIAVPLRDLKTNTYVQWAILAASAVVFLELLRECSTMFAVVTNAHVPRRHMIRALLMPGEVQLDILGIIWGVVFLAVYPPLAPLRAWRVMRVFWYVEPFTPKYALTFKKMASFVVSFLEKIGRELATRMSRGTWIVIALYFFTVYAFAVTFWSGALGNSLHAPIYLPVTVGNNTVLVATNKVTLKPWIGDPQACDTLGHCYLTLLRLSLLDDQGFDFLANLSNAEFPALVALAIGYLCLTAIMILNGLLGIQRATITAQEVTKTKEPARAGKEVTDEILQRQEEMIDEVFQYIPNSAGDPVKLVKNASLQHVKDELAQLSQESFTLLRQRWFFRALLFASFSISFAEVVLIAFPDTVLAQEILLAVATALFVVVTGTWACKIRDMNKRRRMTMGTIIAGLISIGATQLEIGCLLIGWFGLYYNAAAASLRIYRVARVLWYIELGAPKENSRFYAVRNAVYQFTRYLEAMGTELGTLKSKGGLVVLAFFFYASYLFGVVFWRMNQLPEFATTAAFWSGNNAACSSLAHCFITLLRLSLFDTEGLDFLVDMAFSPYPALGALAILYLCFTSFMLINGMIGIFGATFALATQTQKEASDDCSAQIDENEPGVLFLMGNGRILRSTERYAFPLPAAPPEMEGVYQILSLLELERRLEIHLLPKQEILRRWDKAVEVARTTSFFTLLTLFVGILSICEAVLVAFPGETDNAQIAILTSSTILFLWIEYRVLDQAYKACPDVPRNTLLQTFASAAESRLDLFGLLIGWVFFWSIPQLAALRAVRVFRVTWMLQKHPSVRPVMKKIAYLIVNYIEAVLEEFSAKTTNGGTIVLACYFFLTYVFSVVLRAETAGDARFTTVPTGDNLGPKWFFLVMRASLYDNGSLAFLSEAVELSPAVGVLGFIYLIWAAVVLLNGLLGIFGGVFLASTYDEAEKDDSEVAQLLMTKKTDQRTVLQEQAKLLQAIEKLLCKLLPHTQSVGDLLGRPSSEKQEGDDHSNLPENDYSAAVYRACGRPVFRALLAFSCCLTLAESILVGFEFKGGVLAAQFVVLAFSTITLIAITAFLLKTLREMVVESWFRLLLTCFSSIGVQFEVLCLIYGWIMIFAHPAAAPLRCLRLTCILWYVKAGTFQQSKQSYSNVFGKLSSLGVQYFESLTREFGSPRTRGGPSILFLFFFGIYIFGLVLYFATSGLPMACTTRNQCFQVMLFITAHDSQGFAMLAALADVYPALAFLFIVLMVLSHFILLNCVIGIFAFAFANRERHQLNLEAEKQQALLQREFESLAPRVEVMDKLKFYLKQDVEAELEKKRLIFGETLMEELHNAFYTHSQGRFRLDTKDFARLYRSLTQEFNVSLEMLQDMVSEYDPLGEGSVTFTSFLAAMAKHQERLMIKAETADTFKKYDIDGDGSVSAKELNICMLEMNMRCTPAQIEEILREADMNGDGRVDYDEFVEMILE